MAVLLVRAHKALADSVEIGRHTMKVALSSIWLGIALSLGLMLVAAFGYIPAVAGALAQELVDLAAILNALRALSGGRKARAGGAPHRDSSAPAVTVGRPGR